MPTAQSNRVRIKSTGAVKKQDDSPCAATESSIADLHWQKMVMVSKQTEANLLKEFRKK